MARPKGSKNLPSKKIEQEVEEKVETVETPIEERVEKSPILAPGQQGGRRQ